MRQTGNPPSQQSAAPAMGEQELARRLARVYRLVFEAAAIVEAEQSGAPAAGSEKMKQEDAACTATSRPQTST